jgi:hypothetical protein
VGRHSAPDDAGDTRRAPARTGSHRGRHASPDEAVDRLPDLQTERLGYVDQPPPPAPQSRLQRPRVARGNQSTAEDLALLRAHADVRNRVIAAMVVPLVLYAAALLLTGKIDLFLIWAWAPIVTAGVIAGSILDAAHRKRGRG